MVFKRRLKKWANYGDGSIIHQKAEINIACGFRNHGVDILAPQIELQCPHLYRIIVHELNAELVQQFLTPRYQDEIKPYSCELSSKFGSKTGGSPGHQRPRSVTSTKIGESRLLHHTPPSKI